MLRCAAGLPGRPSVSLRFHPRVLASGQAVWGRRIIHGTPAAHTVSQASPGAPTIDYTLLASCVAALRLHWVPAKVQAVAQTASQGVALSLRTASSHSWLYIEWRPDQAHLGLGPGPGRRTEGPGAGLGPLLQSRLAGRVLTGARLPTPWERVVELSFSARPSSGPEHRLYYELTGRQTNIVLTDEQGRVIGVARKPGKADRQLRPGQLYTPPPPGPGIAPESVGDLEAWRRLIERAAETDAGLAGCLVRAFRGVSPLLAAAICSGLQEQDTSAVDWQRAWERWRVWVDRAREGGLLPGPDWRWGFAGQDHEHGVESAAALQQLLFDVHEAVQHRRTTATPTATSAEDRFAKEKSAAAAQLKAALRLVERRASALSRSLEAAEDAEPLRKEAQLLMAHAHEWRPGTGTLDVEDWENPGVTVTLRLPDTSASPIEAAEAAFARARKSARGQQTVAGLLRRAEDQLSRLREAQLQLSLLEGAQDRDAIPEILVGVQDCLPSKRKEPAKAKAKPRESQGPRRLAAPVSGAAILIGRSSAENDRLSTRTAGPLDVWMHARGVGGAHLVLRWGRAELPCAADLAACADLAAWFSGARGSGSVPVTVAWARDVRKPRGAAQGQVEVRRELAVLQGAPERGRLACEPVS